jgi:hypothetical protein
MTGDGFAPYADYLGQDGRRPLMFLAQEVFWQMVVEGILAPGMDSHNLNLPWFHVTKHGREVLASSEPKPYDPTGYLARLRERMPNPDPTVIAYLAESLETFRKNNRVASTVMLGIAPSGCSCCSAMRSPVPCRMRGRKRHSPNCSTASR